MTSEPTARPRTIRAIAVKNSRRDTWTVYVAHNRLFDQWISLETATLPASGTAITVLTRELIDIVFLPLRLVPVFFFVAAKVRVRGHVVVVAPQF